MGTVPETYFDFIMNYAPYAYVIPGSGPDPTWGKTAFAAAFAIDFLSEAYESPWFEVQKAEVYDKIMVLADWLQTQQCTDPDRLANGGFKSTETGSHYYSVDAARAIPALIRAYRVTGTIDYLDAAKLSGATFLYTMQHPPTPTIHDKYYGGFARAVTITDTWLPEMDIENLYGLIGLKMLADCDPTNKTRYETMMTECAAFLRSGLESFYLEYRPPPGGDGEWHRVGVAENEVYDDPFAYALLGLCDYEGWSFTSQKVYGFINGVRASAQYPAYNPAVCWAGYIDVVKRFPACDYYDAVTAGILWKIRKSYDKSSLEFSAKIIEKHPDEFMFWGVKHADYSPVENKQAMATVCWVSQLLLNYEDPLTRFTQVLWSRGENVVLYSVREAAETVSYGEGVDIKAIVSPVRGDEIVLEPGFIINDYLAMHVFAPIRHHDKIRRKGLDYEVIDVQIYDFQGETLYWKAICRRLLGA